MRAIACVSSDGLLVEARHTPNDDKHRFQALTTGGTLIVGGKTWRELPGPLRTGCGARRYEILSRTESFYFPGRAATFKEWELEVMLRHDSTLHNAWVVGGMSVYNLCMPHVTMLYVSILRTAGGIAKFPFPNLDKWDIVCDQTHTSHTFMIWRKTPMV